MMILGENTDFLNCLVWCHQQKGKKSNISEYGEWLEIHANEFQINHEGSAGKMEVDAVVKMFQCFDSLY